jgi:hypothetical protein
MRIAITIPRTEKKESPEATPGGDTRPTRIDIFVNISLQKKINASL